MQTPCDEQVGRFIADFESVLEDVAGAPLLFTIDGQSDQQYEVRIGTAELVDALFQVSAFPSGATMVHQGVIEAANGDYALLTGLLRGWAAAHIRSGIHEPILYSVYCNLDSGWSAEDFARRVSDTEYYRAYIPNLSHLHPCANWTKTPVRNSTREPVVSAIPTLVISGEFDPLTPVEWGERIASNLARSFHLIVPGGSHGAIFDDECAIQILRAFLADPLVEPDTQCIQDSLPPARVPQ